MLPLSFLIILFSIIILQKFIYWYFLFGKDIRFLMWNFGVGKLVCYGLLVGEKKICLEEDKIHRYRLMYQMINIGVII